MAKRIIGTTPKQDGFRMPGEYEPQDQVWMLWPERPDVWRSGAKPAQKAYVEIAKAISEFTPVTVCASKAQYANARYMLPRDVRVVEMSADDAWIRDTGPTFVINDKGDVRAVDWEFNAYGGFYDGLYFPWDQDDAIAQKVCEIERVDTYRAEGFVLEGGSIHVDGEGTLLTTEMCLLSPGRNPHLTKEEIEEKLKEYLNLEKIIWIKDGIDPEETTGHVDDVACFARPGEVICIWEENEDSQFYQASRDAYEFLSNCTDAKGRKLVVHKLCMPKKYVTIQKDFEIDLVEGTLPREEGDVCISSYLNFLITNNGVIVPQYGDENDALAVKQLQEVFPDKKVVGVPSWEVVYGGGNIHCITQQQPSGQRK
ncbi:MAG: agmatine deiminase [Erysipelotrichales bacterium]|nr:agmatine deiminase [Erysipelotrichales bacterium]